MATQNLTRWYRKTVRTQQTSLMDTVLKLRLKPYQNLVPRYTKEQAISWRFSYVPELILDQKYKHQLITESSIGWDENDQVLFVFRKGVLGDAEQLQALHGLKAMGWSKCHRSKRKELKRADWFNRSEGQLDPVPAEEVNMGFGARSYIYDMGSEKKYYKQNQKAAPDLTPLLLEMAAKFGDVLPKLFGQQDARVKLPFRLQNLPFTTLTLLRSAPAAIHVDHNGKAMYACMTSVAPQKYTGGTFCLVQYGLSFAVTPGDLLVAATSENEHCNLNPVVGEKYSVIAYVKKVVTNNKRLRDEYIADPKNPGGRRFPKRKRSAAANPLQTR